LPASLEALRALLTGAEPVRRGTIPPMAESDFYTTSETAKILRLSMSRVRALAADGQLEAARDESGNWRFPAHAVHARMPERPAREAPDLDALDENRRLHERLEDLQRLLGRMEGQRELQAMAESTLKEYLDRERQRADALELEAKRLRDELDKARLPWWRRWFGSETEDRL
jgi:excisionase family DNA binding protein